MNRIRTAVWAALAGLSLLPGAAAAETLVLKTGWLRLEGDSTLHSYRSTATRMSVTGVSAASAPEAIKKDGGLAALDVVIEVEGLKSGDARLDKNLYAALKAEKNPQIAFRLSRHEAPPGSSPGQGQAARARGTLSIAGAEKPVVIEALVSASAGEIRVSGSHGLLMSDFGVQPPRLMFGAIKVRDPVVIRFELVLEAAK